MAGQLQYFHNNGSALTNPLEVRAASLLTAFSKGVEETPGGGAAASIEFPSPAEVSGSAQQGCREAARGSRGPKAYCLLGQPSCNTTVVEFTAVDAPLSSLTP